MAMTASSSASALQLPLSVVVGQESSGKSSVLESLSMLLIFPRYQRICTRMSIHLKLRHIQSDGGDLTASTASL